MARAIALLGGPVILIRENLLGFFLDAEMLPYIVIERRHHLQKRHGIVFQKFVKDPVKDRQHEQALVADMRLRRHVAGSPVMQHWRYAAVGIVGALATCGVAIADR